jgi:hypothetical protein
MGFSLLNLVLDFACSIAIFLMFDAKAPSHLPEDPLHLQAISFAQLHVKGLHEVQVYNSSPNVPRGSQD